MKLCTGKLCIEHDEHMDRKNTQITIVDLIHEFARGSSYGHVPDESI